jgi:hypothetical protein
MPSQRNCGVGNIYPAADFNLHGLRICMPLAKTCADHTFTFLKTEKLASPAMLWQSARVG